MSKSYYSLGLMSGTSGDGIDASIITSNGENQHESIIDRYFEYSAEIIENIHELKNKVKNSSKKLTELSVEASLLEEKITLFHVDVVNKILSETQTDVDLVGFHGQTILHSPLEKITRQLGNGELLSELTKKKVVYNFRQNDLDNGGQGAPLTPVFHKQLKNKYKLKIPLIILNIGGIANATLIDLKQNLYSQDIGPGNCLLDNWIRNNSKKKYDNKGDIAKSGKVNKKLLNQALENFKYNKEIKSYDVKDFNVSFSNDLLLEDGAATLTEFTSEILKQHIEISFKDFKGNILLSGGGRKNNFLVKKIKEKINLPIKSIDEFGVDGDFVESQAFAYLAIRSLLKLPISYPETTGCNKPVTGGVVVKNY